MRKLVFVCIVFFFSLVAMGCGYTTSSLLPAGLDSIYVENFKNKIAFTKDITDKRASYSYRAGMETDITKAVIHEFVLERNLSVEKIDRAALLLKGELVDFRLYPLAYDGDENVEELRLEIIVNLELYDNRTGETMWGEKNFMGEKTYTLTGSNATTEEAALTSAINDLAKRIVERTVEMW